MSYAVEQRPGELIVELRLAVAALPTDTTLLCENLLPENGLFIGLLDRGSASEEKVLCYAKGRTAYVQVRGFDGTRAFAHARWDQGREARWLASSMAVQMQQMFGMGMISKAMLDPHRLERMEKLALAPVSEWIAEGEARAEKEWVR